MNKTNKKLSKSSLLPEMYVDSNVKRHATVLDSLIGLQIRKIRKSRKLTQASIADILKLSYQQVQKYEQGQNRISASTLFCIAVALDHPIEDFFKLVQEYMKE